MVVSKSDDASKHKIQVKPFIYLVVQVNNGFTYAHMKIFYKNFFQRMQYMIQRKMKRNKKIEE